MATYIKPLDIHTLTEQLMKQLSKGKLVPTNICPNCGGIIDDLNKCQYCGAKLKLVVDKDDD